MLSVVPALGVWTTRMGRWPSGASAAAWAAAVLSVIDLPVPRGALSRTIGLAASDGMARCISRTTVIASMAAVIGG